MTLSEPILAGIKPMVMRSQLQQDQSTNKKQRLRHFTFVKMKELQKTEEEIRKEYFRIDKLSEADLDFELEKIQFAQNEQFTNKVAHLIRDTTGWFADKTVKGDGYIKKEFEDDQALKGAIAQRLIGKVGLLGVTGQIALLAASNIFHGLKNKFHPPPPQQQNNNPSSNNNNNNNNNIINHEPPRG